MYRDWNKIQGYYKVTDNHIKPRRDINYRHISIENESGYTIGISLEDSMRSLSKPAFLLKNKEIRDLAVTEHGSQEFQVIRVFDTNGVEIGHPCPLRSDANSYVIRTGINNLFVHTYYKGSIAVR